MRRLTTNGDDDDDDDDDDNDDDNDDDDDDNDNDNYDNDVNVNCPSTFPSAVKHAAASPRSGELQRRRIKRIQHRRF